MAAPQSWQIHWRVPFMSQSGIAYTIGIYEWAYTGSVITLKGGPSPFTTQEADDDDIFRPMRGQTGYLRVVLDESESSYLEQLMPANNTEKLVRLTHTEDNAVVIDWQGFMQTRVFSQPWENNAHMVEFPLNSMLASLEHKRVSSSYANSGVIRALGVITTALESLGENLMGGCDIIDDCHGAWASVMVDWNAFFATETDQEEGYTMRSQYGKSWKDALEAVCEVFGLQARECGNRLVLAQYDNGDSLTLRTMNWATAKSVGAGQSSLPSGSSLPAPLDVLDKAEWRGSDNQANYLPGAHKIEIDFSPGSFGSILMAAPDQDLQDIAAKELKLGYPAGNRGNAWVQSSERNYANENFINKGLHHDEQGEPSTYEDITAEQCRLGFSVLGTGYMPPPPYLINWGTGAWPCIFGSRSKPTETVNMRPGIFLQQLLYESTFPTQNVYSLMSAGSVSLKSGNYINIQMSHHYFEFTGFGEIDEHGTMGAKDIYLDGDGLESQVKTVMELTINVGTKAFQSQRNLPQTMQDIIDNNLENYGKGSWVETGGRDVYTFCIAFDGTDMIYNPIEETNFISYDGGFLVPVTQDMTGRLIVKIRNVFAINFDTLGNYTSRIIENFQVSLLQTAPAFYSENTSNKYKRNLDNGFKAEIQKNLRLGTINYNSPSPALLLNADGTYLQKIPYTPGDTGDERPEVHLLGRMADYYNETRHAYAGQIFKGLDLYTKRWQIDDDIFMAVDATHEWARDRQTVRFIETENTQ